MHNVLISLAANCDHEQNLQEARKRLQQVLSAVSFTSELWTEPEGSPLRPDLYLNQLASGQTDMGVDELCQWLKQTERSLGRTSEDRRQGIVRIDLDLLQYDGLRHHLKDWERSYIKCLLELPT